MKPLNTQERKTAFLRFLAFYAITLLVVSAIVFFGFKTVSVQHAKLKDKTAFYDRQQKLFADYEKLVDSVTKLQHTVTVSDTTNNKEVRAGIAKLMIQKDSFSNTPKVFYTGVYNILSTIKSDDDTIIHRNIVAKASAATFQALKKQSDSLERALAECTKKAKKAAAVAQEPDYHKMLDSMLHSLVKFQSPHEDAFYPLLCLGGGTPVILKYEEKPNNFVQKDKEPHTFDEVYSKFDEKPGSKIITEVKIEKRRKKSGECVSLITIIWKYTPGLHVPFSRPEKLFR